MTTGRMTNKDQHLNQRPTINEENKPSTPIQDPKSPFNANPNPNENTPTIAFAYSPPQPQKPSWFDRMVDALVGEEGPTSKYALICERCHTHNGLVLPEELEDVQYFCPKCHHFNPSRRKRRSATTTDVNQLSVPDEASLGRPQLLHRTSLPDLRVANTSDVIEGARNRVERDAISDVGIDSDRDNASSRVASPAQDLLEQQQQQQDTSNILSD
jgi:hypothetical protein